MMSAMPACEPAAERRPAAAAGLPAYVPTPQAPEPTPEARTPRRLRRLANFEMEAVIRDLLDEPSLSLSSIYLPDPRVEGYDNDAVALGVSESKVEEIVMTAERVAAHLTAGESLQRHAPCAASEDPGACVRRFAARAATVAWGRPPSDEELARLAGIYEVGRTSADDGYRGGVELVAQAVLQSPHFVYRSELGEAMAGDAAGGTVTLTGVEIASALSFLLRGSRPDAPLLEAALRGDLASAEVREREARRLLASEAGRRRMRHFLRSWLGLVDVAMINKDVGAFPFFSPRARRALDRELDTFLDHVLLVEGARLDELLLADYTFPGPELMPFYGDELLEPAGDFQLRRLDPSKRRGVLSSPAFLAAHALIDQTNPVERGLMVRDRFFCQDVAPPPPDVLAQTPGGPPEQTTRQHFEAHSRDARCSPCHRLIDPLGFGFEQFDAVGRYRTMERGIPVDARGEILGTDVDGPFTGPVELAPRLVRSAQFRRCFVEQLYRYSEGRTVDPRDDRELDYLASLFEQSEHRIDELFVRLVRRPAFVLRRSVPEVGP
jgi:hypothetical protein